LRKSFHFGGVQRYELTFTLPLHNDALLSVLYEPKDEKRYHAKLESYAVRLPLLEFVPVKTNGSYHLRPIAVETLAYIDVVERSTNVKGITRVTANETASEFIGKPVLSPTEDVMVYEVFGWQEQVTQHKVRAVETWPAIAAQYGLGAAELQAFHDNAAQSLRAGRVVEVPRMKAVSNIYQQRVGAFARTRVTDGAWRDLHPCLSADGREVIFSSNRTSHNHILWRRRLDGAGGITKVTDATSEDFDPCAGPDAELLAYVSMPPGAERAQIWTVHVNGALPSQLGEGRWPQLAPDGQRLLFLRNDIETGKSQIWMMNLDGTNQTQMTQNREYDIIDAQWSPDGRWIVYAADEEPDERGRRNWDIYLMAMDSQVKTRLTRNGSWDDGPRFDRAGRYIYFRSNRGGMWNIWRCEPKRP